MDDEFALFTAEIGALEQQAATSPAATADAPAGGSAAARCATITKAPAHVPAGPSLPGPQPSASSGQVRPMVTPPLQQYQHPVPMYAPPPHVMRPSPPYGGMPHAPSYPPPPPQHNLPPPLHGVGGPSGGVYPPAPPLMTGGCGDAGLPGGAMVNVEPSARMELKRAAATVGDDEKPAPAKKIGKPIFRQAGGDRWEDKSLGDWPENDYRIFVGDLGPEVNDDMLVKAFAKYPTFQKAKVLKDKSSGKSRGYGFVSLLDPADYARAMKEMNGRYIGNRPCKLKKSDWATRNDQSKVKNKVPPKRKPMNKRKHLPMGPAAR